MARKKRMTPVPFLVVLALILLGMIVCLEEPELVPLSQAVPVFSEGGSGGSYLPDDPDQKLTAFANQNGMIVDIWPENLRELLRDDPGAESLVLNYPYYSVDWEALQDLSQYDDDPQMQWGFARDVGEQEQARRMQIVQTAQSWLGTNEADGGHQNVLDVYNTHTPLARDYPVQPEDDWCATFASTVAIQCDMTNLIPTECSCIMQIGLFQEKGCWQEQDDYVPLPGDYIYYHWECTEEGDCQGAADHVGIVVGTAGPFIKVMEGNKHEVADYRVVMVGAQCIRGYGLPRY